VHEEDERVIWTGRPSWRGRLSILAPGLVLAVLVFLLLLWVGVDLAVSLVVALVIAVVAIVWGLLETLRWKYTITSRRVFVRHGLVSVNEQSARLERVQDLTLRQTLFDRLFGVGALEIDTAGSEGGALQLKALERPARVREILETAVREEQQAGV
jgi:uncharacterized membrane protein YdbT with pleckstrin-like domain